MDIRSSSKKDRRGHASFGYQQSFGSRRLHPDNGIKVVNCAQAGNRCAAGTGLLVVMARGFPAQT
jgi:hypothetical protein